MIQHSTIRLSLTLGFAIALGQAAFAQPAERPPRGGERPDREALRKQILERFDKNKDGELDEEEREAMPDFIKSATLELRHQLGMQWLRFYAERESLDGVDNRDKDADEYIEEHSP